MLTPSIYGEYAQYLPKILQEITDPIIVANITSKKETGFKLYEHFISRIKESDSMREKCRRKNLPETSQSALKEIRDSIGIRIVHHCSLNRSKSSEHHFQAFQKNVV